MFNTQSVSIDWAGRKLTLETGHIARQADGAVFATWGETALLATAVAARDDRLWASDHLARVAKLVDAPGLGPDAFTGVGVRVPPLAPTGKHWLGGN